LCAVGAGLVATLLAVVVIGILRLLVGIATPVELFGDYVLKHMDVHTFIRFLRMFQPNPKTTPLGLALLGMIGIGTMLALPYAALLRLKLPLTSKWLARREWLIALSLTAGLTLIGMILFWEELRQNYLGLPIFWERLTTTLALLLAFGVYSVALVMGYRLLLPAIQPSGEERSVAPDRRQMLIRLGVLVLGISAGVSVWGLIGQYLKRYAAYDGFQTPSSGDATTPITPNELHYIVTKNTVDPSPEPELWRLEIDGLVEKPGSYTYDEIRKLPATSRAITLECIANGADSHLISTAVWQGVALKTLLERLGGAKPEARFIAFYAVDGFNMSLPLDEVLAVDPLLAWLMNGVALPQRHGFPLRALIPGRYGEENVKWLTRIELTDHFVDGLYSSQGWYNGPLHTISRIDRPTGRVTLGQNVEVGGIAFAGNRGIQKVEVSVDDGKSWHDASLQPSLSPDTWVLWTWQWKPIQAGSYTLTARATDGTGEVQTSAKQGTVPNGATGLHRIKVEVH
jgi:DMSO/TMAO reductase YedYZ molybdopterin-dependent catalytic subunit